MSLSRMVHVTKPKSVTHVNSALYGFQRITGHLPNAKATWTEVQSADGKRKYVIEKRSNTDEKGQIVPFQSELKWHSFLNVHPSALQSLLDTTDCILCGSCTAACPSYWWNNDQYLGPAAMLQAWRWLWDQNNDMATFRRKLDTMKNTVNNVDFCHNIGNCTQVCPKGIQVDRAMNGLRLMASMS